jgi:hypothetical protein
MRRLFAVMLFLSLLAVIPACGQQFPGQVDELTTSLGSFIIQVTNGNAAGLLAGCPAFKSPFLSSPVMFDPQTKVGLSNALLDRSPADINGVPVGTAGTLVKEAMLSQPPNFPCGNPVMPNCKSGAGTREIHTEVRSLHMTGGGAAVRAGVWYNNPVAPAIPPNKISPGEVESHSGPGGPPALDLPASSFFDMFVQVDVPACGAFPATTVYNSAPLIVDNFDLTSLPPRVIYLHDLSSSVPVLFLNANPPHWNANDILGYIVLAGHGIGFTNSSGDIAEFTSFMNQQPVHCVSTGGTSAAERSASGAPAAIATPTPVPCTVSTTTN